DAAAESLGGPAGTRVRWHAAKPQAATEANIKSAVAFMESAHLIGALDVGNALAEIHKRVPAEQPTYVVHVGSGVPAMGELRGDALVKQLPAGTRYVGVGVGRRWNRSFMKDAAEKTGGHFTQINPDEPIAWRAFDLFATLATPRLFNVEVVADDGQTEIFSDSSLRPAVPKFHVFQQTIAQGEEICAITRVGPAL